MTDLELWLELAASMLTIGIVSQWLRNRYLWGLVYRERDNGYRRQLESETYFGMLLHAAVSADTFNPILRADDGKPIVPSSHRAKDFRTGDLVLIPPWNDGYRYEGMPEMSEQFQVVEVTSSHRSASGVILLFVEGTDRFIQAHPNEWVMGWKKDSLSSREKEEVRSGGSVEG